MQLLKELCKGAKRRLRNFTMHDEEYDAIKVKADKYAGGNVSHWIRYASMNYIPKKDELIEIDRKKE